MGLLHALSFEYRCDKCGGKAVAGTYGIGYLNLGCGPERHVARGEHVAAVDAAGEDEHLQVVFAQKNPTFVVKVDVGITEYAAYGIKFLVIYLKNVAPLHRVAEYLSGVESLTQVDIEH